MVRATFAGFTTAISALQANQKRLDISGQNLSNMNTPGYTRQALQVSSVNYTNPISHYMNGTEVAVGFGVHMDKVTQIRDPYLDVQYRNQMDKSGYTDAMQSALDRLSDIFDESHINGIHQAFLNIRSTLENQHDPSKVNDAIFESELRSRMQTLANLLNDASNQLDAAEKIEYSKLDGRGTNEQGSVDQINEILRQIGSLNRQIKQNQIFGQQSLELMDERNVLLDELSSYIPIEVTYYKDIDYDGNDDGIIYDYDSHGSIIGKRDWPDDLRVEMVYQDANGATQKLTLVEGTIGSEDDNYGKVSFKDEKGYLNDPTKTSLTFTGLTRDPATGELNPGKTAVEFDTPNSNAVGDPGKVGNHFADNSGSIQASLDMLWKDGMSAGIEDKRGYEYYRKELDTLASSFAKVVNTINQLGEGGGILLVNKNPADPTKPDEGITAANIGISVDWQGGTTHIGTSTDRNPDMNATLLNLLEAMDATYPYDKFLIDDGTGNNVPLFPAGDVNLKDNSFADYMNHISTILANDSFRNTEALKTNVTVLNGIQNSRDSVSGVSLDEEASNMMMYMSAYNAASRLMTTLDQALDVLINSTGVVGR